MKNIIIATLLLITVFGCSKQNSTPVVNSNPPNNLSLSFDQSQIVVSGACSSAQTVTILDLYGNPTSALNDQTIHLASATTTVGFYSDSGCLTPISVVKIKSGTSSAVFYIKDSATGYFSFSATTSNISADTQSHTAVSPDATQITLTSPTTVGAGACSTGLTVSTENYASVVSNVTDDTAISFSNLGLGKIYLQPDCSDTGGTTATVPAGSSSVIVYFKASKVGGYNVTATAPGNITASSFIQIQAGSPSQMAFITAPQTLSAGNCSGVFTIQYQDSYGNAASFTTDTPVNLNGTGVTFYSDSSCSTAAITTATVSSNSTNVSFYVSATSTAANLVTISGVGSDQSQSLSVTAGGSSKLSLPTLVSAITAGAPFSRINIQVLDQYGNVVTGFNRLYSLAAYSDNACTHLSTTSLGGVTQVTTSSSASFIGINYTKAETIYMGISSVGLTSACSPAVVVNPDFASKLVLNGTASQKVGVCSAAFNVSSADQYGNASTVATNFSLNLSGGGSGLFYTANDCSGNPVTTLTLPANTPSVNFYFKDQTVEGLILSTAGLGSIPATFPLSVVAGDPTQIQFFAPATITAGVCSSGFTVKLLDSYGNTATATTALTMSLTENGSAIFYTDATCLNNVTTLSVSSGSNSKVFYVKDNTSESLNIDIQSLSFDYKILTVSPAAASQLAFRSLPATVSAGAVFPAVQVGIEDANGNVLSNATNSVSLTAYIDSSCKTESTIQISGTRTQTAVSSIATFNDLSDSSATTIYLGAASGSLTSACSFGIQITPSNAAQLSLTTTAVSPTAGTCIPITVSSQDSQGNASVLTANTAISLNTSNQIAFFSTNDCSGTPITSTQISQGSSSSLFYGKDTKAETANISAANMAFVPAALSIIYKESTPVKLLVSGPSTIVGGKCSAYSVQSLDTFNNLAKVTTALTATLQSTGSGLYYSDPNCLNLESTTTIESGSNLATIYVKDSTIETINLTAVSAGFTAVPLSGVVVTSGVASQLVMTGLDTLSTGTCATYTIQAQDTYGNPATIATDTTVTLQNFSYGQFFTSANCSGSVVSTAVIPNHLSQVVISFMDSHSEGITVQASTTGLTAGIKTITINPSSANKVVINSTPKTVTAGICSTSIDFKLTDNLGNFVNATSNVSIDLTDSNIAYYGQAGCGSAPITSTQIASGSAGVSVYAIITKSSVTSLNMNTTYGAVTQAVTVTAQSAAKVDFAQLPLSGVPGSNAFSVPIIIQPSDEYGNANLLFSGNVTITSFQDSACSAPTANPLIGTTQQQFVNGAASFSNIGYSQSGVIYIKSSSAGLASNCSAAISISASNPSQIILSGLSSVVSGICSGPFTVSSKDSFGNLASVSSNLTLTFSGLGTGASVNDTSSCSNGSSNTTLTFASNTSSKVFYLKGSIDGNYTMSVASTLGSSTLNYSVTSGTASAVVIAGATGITSGSCNAYTITSTDSNGNIANVTQSYTFPLSGKSSGNFYADSACGTAISSISITSGSSTQTFYFSDSTIGDSTTLTTVLSGFTVSGQPVMVQSPPPAEIILSGLSTITVGTCSPYVIQLSTVSGAAATSTTATTVTLSGSGSGSFYSDSGCVSSESSTIVPAGQATKTVYFKDGSSESLIFIAASTGMSSGVYPVSINSGSATAIVFSVEPQATTVAGVTLNTLVANYVDQYNNIVYSSSPITLTVLNSDLSAGPAIFGTAVQSPNSATGNATFAGLSIQTSRTFYIKASGNSISSNSTSFVISPAAPSVITKISGDNQSGLYNTQFATAFIVAVSDQYGNLVPNASVLFDPQSSGGTFTPATAQLTTTTGQVSATFKTGSTTAGVVSVRAYVTTNTAVTVSFSETIVGIKSLGVVGPASLLRNSCTGPYTIQALNQSGSLTTTSIAVATSLSASDGGVSFYTAAGCGTQSSSYTLAVGTSSTQFYVYNSGVNSFTITASASLITSGTENVVTYATRLSTTGLNYGTTNATADQSLTLINDGATLTIPAFSYSYNGSYFQLISDGCSNQSIPQNGSCTITIRFLAGNCGIPNGVNTSGSLSNSTLGLSATLYGNTSYTWTDVSDVNQPEVYNEETEEDSCVVTGSNVSGACSSKCITNAWTETASKGNASCGTPCCRNTDECL